MACISSMKFWRRKLLFVMFVVLAVLFVLPVPKAASQFGVDQDQEGPPKCFSNGVFYYPSVSSSPTGSDEHVTDRFTRRLHLESPPGFNTLSRLYFFNGTLYAVVPDQESKKDYPELKYILSQLPKEKKGSTLPTDKEMQILTEEEIKPIIPSLDSAVVVNGLSMILYDPNNFMHHYYHWWGEIILGVIRAYSALALLPYMESPLMEPARWILANIPDASWRDRAGVNGPLMRAGFPNAPIENGDFWRDMSALQRPFVFERAMIVERDAAQRSPLGSVWFKMVSSTMNVTVPRHFWEPLRQRVVRNTVGYLPLSVNGRRPQVLYISRQLSKNGRRLSHTAHADLVRALKELEKDGICDVTISAMETLSFQEQVKLSANAMIMIGVHGNGLTHQLWMPPSPQSTVIEITYPKTYIHDYSMLSRNMGHKHYAVWNDSTLTFPEGEWYKGINHGDRKDFHGPNIPVYGDTVANVIRERLSSH